MKKLVLFIYMVPFFAAAQNEGTVVYQTTASLQINVEDSGHSSEFSDMLPKERKFKNQLTFKDGTALYKAVEDEEPNEIRGNSGGGEFVFKMATPDNKIYHDLNKNELIESREFLGKYFLISGEPVKYKWKMTGESKTIAGYTCQQASFTDSTQTVIAWFTPEIPVSLGPGNYGQLPGLILGMDFDEGSRIVEATEIKLAAVNVEDIAIPKRGKKVTRQEYDNIVEEKMKEMGATRQGGGVRMIITEEVGGH